MGAVQEVLTIASLERLQVSGNGSPRFKVTFTNGREARTEADSYVNYAIENSEYQGVPLEVAFSLTGRITHIKVA